MKFLCIIFGCPAGARKWHIIIFAMLLHNKMDEKGELCHEMSLLRRAGE